MYQLVFQTERICRTTTRAEWKAIWRWRRETERTLNAWAEKNREVLTKHAENIMIFGTSTLMIEDFINPPILIYPDVPQCNSIDLRPGAVSYIK